MLNNAEMLSLRLSDVFVPDSERLVNNFLNNSGARELVRMMAIGVGVPVDNLYEIHNIGRHGLACILYMYEEEYCGTPDSPSVWGSDYTRDLLGTRESTGSRGSVGRDSLWFRSGIDKTDILCLAYITYISSNKVFLFDKLLAKYKDNIDKARFTSFIDYMISSNTISAVQLGDMLLHLQDGALVKVMMDALNGTKSSVKTRDILIRLRDSAGFNNVCAHVTSKIAESLTASTASAT